MKKDRISKRGMATLAGAILTALAVGSVPLASAALDGGNFNIRAINDEDASIFGLAGMRVATVTDPGGGGETPDPEPEPEAPKEKFAFTISTTAPGCANPVVSFAGLSNSPTITNPSGTKVALAEGSTAVAADGKWTVEGNFNKFAVGTGAASNCILSVDQWGATGTTDLSSGFAYARNLTAVAMPPVTVQNMSNLFTGATSFQQDLSGWPMDGVTDISGMFAESSYNQPLNGWNTSNVTTMAELFRSNTAFNQPLNAWNVSKVTTMRSMFERASSFNQPLNGWQTLALTDLQQTFDYADSFDQDISSWNTSKVTTMNGTFRGTVNFDQALNSWNVSKVTDMANMFYGSSFNRSLSSWNVNQVQSMENMFRDNRVFNRDLSMWGPYQVRNMSFMFSGAWNFSMNLGSWYVGNVTSAQHFADGANVISKPNFPSGSEW